MDPNETMVDETEVAEDDALSEGPVEETDESEESLDSFMEEGEPEEEEDKKESQGTSEPGWIRKRVDKAVSKAVAETEARMKAQFDAQMAPIRERLLEDEAQKLVQQGTVADLDTAKELLRYRQGLPAPTPQPRNDKGQFAPKEDPAVNARIEMLRHQAANIKSRQGIDVIAEWNSNPEFKKKVISGEMDFYDIADAMSKKKRTPSPMRSPNGASGAEKTAIDNMSDAQFARLEKRIKEGARYSLR